MQIQILVDNQKVVTVDAVEAQDEEGDTFHLLAIDGVYDVLEAWRLLDESRRHFSWPDGGGNHDALVVAWYTEASGLVVEEGSPFWDGRVERRGHAIEHIEAMLPIDTLDWDILTTEAA
jgi:hypothetical protein